MDIQLVRATPKEAGLILRMQKESFAKLLEKYEDMETNPANETIDKVVMRLNQDFTYFYLIQMQNENIGAIRVVDKKEEHKKKRISPLFILPKYWNRGIAQKAIQMVEEIHGSNEWELDTILQEDGNCHLYEKMGYERTGKIKIINEKMTLVLYEK